MSIDRILVIGSSGVLGGYVMKAFSNAELLTPSHTDLDITKEGAVASFFTRYKPTTVLHLAALTDVDFCEQHPEEAFLVNGEGVKHVAKACRLHGARLLYVSTAAVFGGDKASFSEADSPNPVNIYGKSKLAGEGYVTSYVPNALILRTAWLIGGGKTQKKFVSYIVEKAKTEKEIPVVSDVWGTIAYAKDFAEFIRELTQKKETGIHHFGTSGVPTRVDIAKKILELLNAKMTVQPVPSSYFSKSFSAPRPVHEVLTSNTYPFQSSWEDRLAVYLNEEILE